MDEARLLEGLTACQREAVTSTGAPLCILAGPGSGKTRVLTHRIAHRVLTGTADAPHVLALTFTRRAAAELSRRLAALGVRDQVVAGTFHAVAYAQLRRIWADRGRAAPELLERKVRLLARLLPTGGPQAVHPAEVAAEIEWAKARLVTPDDYPAAGAAAGRRPPLPPEQLAAVFRRYEDEKRRRGLLDFDDLLAECAAAIEGDRDVAARQRWRFRHLFVDEFQDVNPAQFRLLEAWRGDRPDLCVVGDPDQAIYAWNGADPTLLAGFAQRYPGSTTVRLVDSFRSTPEILAAAHAVLTGTGRPAGTHLRAHRLSGQAPVVRAHPDGHAEARAVARSLRDRHGPGTPWSHLAVLARTHGQLALVEEALSAASVPYRVRGATPFLDRPEVAAALAELRRAPGRPLDPALVDLDVAARTPRPEDVEAVLGEDEPSDQRSASLLELVRLGREFLAADPAGTTGGFLAWLAATTRRDPPEGPRDAVELATFHAAKGLEWPVVHIVGLEQGFVPIAHARTPAAVDEERRLLYVAVTRAERELHCSWAAERTFGERVSERQPSPWLELLQAPGAATADRPAADTGEAWRARLDAQRRELAACAGRDAGGAATPDHRLVEALRRWRANAARSARVPTSVVLPDSTLAALARALPASRDELLDLPGIGPVKAQRYGEALLGVVADHARRRDA